MTFRVRILLVSVVIAVLPVAAFAFGIRAAVSKQVVAQHELRIAERVKDVEFSIGRQHALLGERLQSLGAEIREDNRLRALLTAGGSDRSYLLDYGHRAMGLSGLTALRLQDVAGRIVTSGHFRNEFDRFDSGVADNLRGAEGPVVAQLRGAEENIMALVRLDSIDFGPARYYIIAGASLTGITGPAGDDMDLVTTLRFGMPLQASDDMVPVVASIQMPMVDESGDMPAAGIAVIDVRHDASDLDALERTMDRGLLLAAGASAVAAVFIAFWLAGMVTRPLTMLADQTRRVDWDRLDVGFASDRSDEVGVLSRMLGGMTARLRKNRSRLQDVERRSTMGELARQVNHDIKNGLVPIRNVVQHLSEVAASDPEQLVTVYHERSSTLQASIQYLENLSANYARLSPSMSAQRTDVNGLLTDVVERAEARSDVRIRTRLSDEPMSMNADPIMLGRIVANLISNGMDAIDERGTVLVSSGRSPLGLVQIIVEDDGRGMTEDEFANAFEDFYTTKNEGTGLGLSIVRRLMADMNGTVRIETQPGAGTRAILEFPLAGEGNQ